jgi:hypothetical protein
MVTAVFVFGLFQQITILNTATVLAWPADEAGLAWVDANLPPDAVIAANAWQWLGNTWAGQDGGAWLTPLTGRTNTAPPIDHIYNRELFAANRAFNEAATAVEDWSAPETAVWLREQGVTHVYVGARGGFFKPDQLWRNPKITLLYGEDGVFVFEIEE